MPYYQEFAFAHTVEACLYAIGGHKYWLSCLDEAVFGSHFVYTTSSRSLLKPHKPTPDMKASGEIWAMSPVKIKFAGYIDIYYALTSGKIRLVDKQTVVNDEMLAVFKAVKAMRNVQSFEMLNLIGG